MASRGLVYTRLVDAQEAVTLLVARRHHQGTQLTPLPGDAWLIVVNDDLVPTLPKPTLDVPDGATVASYRCPTCRAITHGVSYGDTMGCYDATLCVPCDAMRKWEALLTDAQYARFEYAHNRGQHIDFTPEALRDAGGA